MIKNFIFIFGVINLILLSSINAQTKAIFNQECETALIQEIKKAKSEINIAVFCFTRFSIARSLISAKERGVKVKIIIDYQQANTEYGDKIFKLLNNNQIDVKLYEKDDNAHMHHKFIIVDSKRVITGSYNFTTNASKFNDENLLIIDDRKIAKLFMEEWRRLDKKE